MYEDVAKQFPPIPLLPKTFYAKDDSPRSGGMFKFMKLAKFRGMDYGRSKFREEASKIEKINFPDGITIRKLFTVLKQSNSEALFDENANDAKPREPLMTAFGELVYQRATFYKDMLAKQKVPIPGYEQKDQVLEENLVDVRNLLKNATSSQAAHGKQPGQKALVNLQGIEPFYTKKDRFDRTLIFESRFESGNLAAALKITD